MSLLKLITKASEQVKLVDEAKNSYNEAKTNFNNARNKYYDDQKKAYFESIADETNPNPPVDNPIESEPPVEQKVTLTDDGIIMT